MIYHEHVTKEQFCKMIDHAQLSQCNRKEQIDKCCDEVVKYGFGTACLFPCDVKYAKERMGDKGEVCAVIGYPMGQNKTETKIFEAVQAIEDGAKELDFVMNISRFMDGNDEYVLDELKRCVKASKEKDPSVIVKVIIEVYWLDKDEDLERACKLVVASGADYIKQATGYAPDPYHNTRGWKNMAQIRKYAGDGIGLKSAGVPNDLEQMVKMYKELDIDKFGGQFMEWLDEAGDEFWEDK